MSEFRCGGEWNVELGDFRANDRACVRNLKGHRDAEVFAGVSVDDSRFADNQGLVGKGGIRQAETAKLDVNKTRSRIAVFWHLPKGE